MLFYFILRLFKKQFSKVKFVVQLIETQMLNKINFLIKV